MCYTQRKSLKHRVKTYNEKAGHVHKHTHTIQYNISIPMFTFKRYFSEKEITAVGKKPTRETDR